MGERVRTHAWANHPLGEPEGWPQNLKTTLNVILRSPQPMWLAWGEAGYFFCNDAYIPTLGLKEPWALGQPLRKIWNEAWEELGPLVDRVREEGEAASHEGLRLFVERSGYREETFHSLAVSPVIDDEGEVNGILGIANEETERVISLRRDNLRRELAVKLAGVVDEKVIFARVEEAMATEPRDLVFVLFYVFAGNRRSARLAGATAGARGTAFAPETILLDAAGQAWPARAVLETGSMVLEANLAEKFGALPPGAWDRPPRQAAVVPILSSSDAPPLGFLVAGLNPYRPFDPAYETFIHSLALLLGRTLQETHELSGKHRDAETAMQRAREQTEFLGVVSSRLRSRLSLLIGPLEEILRHPEALPKSVRELVTTGHRQSRQLLKIVNALQDYAEAETAGLRPHLAPTDLTALTCGVAESFRETIEHAGLRFIVDCPSLSEPVYVDRVMWEKIVLNLLSNAFKHTAAGEIQVTQRFSGAALEFRVRDTGTGIAAQAIPHIFEHSYRAGQAIGPTPEGLGLGLALAAAQVQAQGGRIAVTSVPGAGSTFTVTIPRGRDHVPAAAGELPPGPDRPVDALTFVEEAQSWFADDVTEATPASPIGSARDKILIIERNPELRRYLALLLAPHYRLISAPGDGNWLETIRTHHPDLVLLGSSPPDNAGLQLLRTIRSHPGLRATPAILLSSRGGETARVEGLEAGADDYIVKPFHARELVTRIAVHLQLARLRGQAEERERELRTNAELFARALRESSERLSTSLAAAGTGTFRWDITTNALDWDESIERLFAIGPGTTARSLAQFLQLIHPDDRAHVRAAYERCARTGIDFEMEFRVPLPDGSVRWFDEKGKTFFADNGSPLYMIGACVDITKRKQTEAFVWRQKDVLEQIVQGAPLEDVLETNTLDVEQVAERDLYCIILMLDATGKRLRFAAGRRAPLAWRRYIDGLAVGPAAASSGTAVHRNERIIVPDIGHHPLWREHRAEAIKLGIRACWSTPIVTSGGKMLGTFDVYYPEPGVPREQELKFVDIATRTAAIAVERERNQAALRESQAKLAEHAEKLEQRVTERTAKLQETISELESFSYSISHDMRAPLRAMQSFAQILGEECSDQLSPEGKDYLRRIIGASDRMDRLIQDVLIYSRVSRAELRLEPIDVGQLLAGILESYPQFHSPRATIEVSREMPRVLGNAAALTQCFSNLLGNAVKFVAPGVQPEVRIWSERRGHRAKIFIRDNGIGIERSSHEKIFHIFYQLDRTFEGTGIGLSVVRKAAERMGGTVGVASEPGQGSTFYLELNAAPDE